MTTLESLQAEYAEAWANLETAKQKMVELCRRIGPERVEDYELQGREGGVRLSEMFGDKPDLILIHNMGSECPYCTMWADGFNGTLRHLQDRAAFVAVSPNSVEVQQAVREKRGWQFEMYSAEGTTFIKDMGFESDGTAYTTPTRCRACLPFARTKTARSTVSRRTTSARGTCTAASGTCSTCWLTARETGKANWSTRRIGHCTLMRTARDRCQPSGRTCDRRPLHDLSVWHSDRSATPSAIPMASHTHCHSDRSEAERGI